MSADNELAAIEAALAGDRSDPELTLLVAETRATAPRMTPAFEQRLDDAVRDGFAKAEPPRRRLRLRVGPTLGLAGATVMAIAIGITVIPGSNTVEHRPLGEGVVTPKTAAGGGAASGAASADSVAAGRSSTSSTGTAAPVPESALATPAPAPPHRVQERAAELTLTTPASKLQTTADAVVGVADRVGGYVQSSNVSSQSRAGEATFDLRVPSSRLDEALAALSRLGHVRSRSQQAQDITASYDSARSRLHDAQAERQGLLKALAAATTTQQIESIKARLRLVRSQIASAQTALNSVRHRANYSRVEVTLLGSGKAAATHHGGSSFTPGRALHDAWRVLSVAAGVAIVAAAGAVPAGLLAVLALLGVRVARRRRREAALDGAAAAV